MRTAFQLYDFLFTAQSVQSGLIDSENQQVIQHLVKKNLRPARTLADRQEPWPRSWGTNTESESLQQALATFEQDTVQLQLLYRLPPSTGATPSRATPSTMADLNDPLNPKNRPNDPLPESSNVAGKRTIARLGTADLVASQVEDITGIQRNPGNQNYSKTSYTRDCIAMLMIAGRLARSEPGYDAPFLRESITNTDVGAAQAIYRLLSDNKKKSVQAEADQILLSSDSPQFILDTHDSFESWIARIREGPGDPGDLDLSPEVIEEVTTSRRPSVAHEPPVRRFFPQAQRQTQQSKTPNEEKFQRWANSQKREESTRDRRDRPDFHQRRPDPYNQEVEEGLARNMAGHNGEQHEKSLGSVDPLGLSPQRRPIATSPQRRPQPVVQPLDQPPAGLFRPNLFENPRRNSEPRVQLRQPANQDHNELAYLRERVAQQEAELRRSRITDPGPEFVPRENRRLESLSGHQYHPPPLNPYQGYGYQAPNDRRGYVPDNPRGGFNPVVPDNPRGPLNPPADRREYDYPILPEGRRRYDNPNPPEERRPRNLRPADVMMFDPQKQTAAFFIRRFRHIAEIEGSEPVLRVLPMCLEGDALEWHNGLSTRVRQEMNHSLAIWEDELLREYRPNRFESLKNAEKMRFRFDDSSMTLSQYLTRKTNHLHDAGVMDEDMIVRYLWQGLDANLALATPMRESGDTIESFNRRVRNNEAAAKRVHELNKPRQKSNFSTAPTPARVQRLFGNLAAKGLVQAGDTKAKPAPVQAKPKRPLETSKTKANERRVKKSPPRPCRHCGKDHWDNDCDDPNRKVMKVESEDVVMDEVEYGDENEEEDLDPYDLETYAALEALAEEESQGEVSQDS